MKSIIKNLILFCLLSIFFGCSKISTDKKNDQQGTYEVAIEGALNLQLKMQGNCTNVFANYFDFTNQGLVNTKSLVIQGRDDQNRLISIVLYFNTLPLDGVFHLGIDDQDITYGGAGIFNPDALNLQSINYSTDDNHLGKCTITDYNQTNQTISGIFEFTGQGYGISGANLAGVIATFKGSFNNVPINDQTDSNNPKGVCYGTTGANIGTGGNNGGGTNQLSTITFINPTFTPINVNFNGQTKTAPVGGNAVFSGSANSTKAGNASTSGKTSNGTLVGLPIAWENISQTFPTIGTNLNYTLDIGNNYFFLKIINKSAKSIQKVYVNYGLTNQTLDNISIPNDGVTYNIGYYKAFSNSNVRAENGSTFWTLDPLNLPFIKNQSKTIQAN